MLHTGSNGLPVAEWAVSEDEFPIFLVAFDLHFGKSHSVSFAMHQIACQRPLQGTPAKSVLTGDELICPGKRCASSYFSNEGSALTLGHPRMAREHAPKSKASCMQGSHPGLVRRLL